MMHRYLTQLPQASRLFGRRCNKLSSLPPRKCFGGLAAGGMTVGGVMMLNNTTRCDGETCVAKQEPSMAAKCFAEAIGTGLIVIGGCGIVCAGKYVNPAISPMMMSSIWGVSVALAVYTTRDVSGGHLNPAVTAALAANGKCPASTVLPYWLSQTAGAAAAGAVNYIIFGKAIKSWEALEGIKRGSPGSHVSFNGAFGMVPNDKVVCIPRAFAAEIWMTAVLAYVIFALGDEDNKTVPSGAAPALVGATVTTLVGIFGPVTGCGMNPARDLGPRLVTAAAGWGPAARSPGWWIYTAGPILGGVLGGAFYKATN